MLTVAVFWRRSTRHVAPVVEPALLAVRAFAWSNATSLLFAVAFAGSLLANILWMEQVWEYSALRTGLGVAPGPLMVPVFAAVAQRVAHRVPIGVIAAAGCLLVGVALVLAVAVLGEDAAYATQMLSVSLIGGVGSVLGVSILVALLGTPVGYAAVNRAFDNVRWALALACVLAAATAVGMTPGTQARASAAVSP